MSRVLFEMPRWGVHLEVGPVATVVFGPPFASRPLKDLGRPEGALAWSLLARLLCHTEPGTPSPETLAMAPSSRLVHLFPADPATHGSPVPMPELRFLSPERLMFGDEDDDSTRVFEAAAFLVDDPGIWHPREVPFGEKLDAVEARLGALASSILVPMLRREATERPTVAEALASLPERDDVGLAAWAAQWIPRRGPWGSLHLGEPLGNLSAEELRMHMS